MADEFYALRHNRTWALAPYKPHMNIIGCKWIFRFKPYDDGTIKHYKACYVAKGFHKKSIDYNDTFSLVIKLLSFAMQAQWHIH